MYRRNPAKHHGQKKPPPVGRARALTQADQGHLLPWRTKTTLQAAAREYTRTGALDDTTLDAVETSHVRAGVKNCGVPGCDSCWHW